MGWNHCFPNNNYHSLAYYVPNSVPSTPLSWMLSGRDALFMNCADSQRMPAAFLVAPPAVTSGRTLGLQSVHFSEVQNKRQIAVITSFAVELGFRAMSCRHVINHHHISQCPKCVLQRPFNACQSLDERILHCILLQKQTFEIQYAKLYSRRDKTIQLTKMKAIHSRRKWL